MPGHTDSEHETASGLESCKANMIIQPSQARQVPFPVTDTL